MSLWLPEIRWNRSLLALPLAGLLSVGVVGTVVSATSPAYADEVELSPLLESYRVEVGDDGIELSPIASDSAVASIELLDDEDEALVNGKAFSRQELEAFLGEDGKEIAALLGLSSEDRRARLGHRDEEEPLDEGDVPVAPGAPGAPSPPHPPGVPHFEVQSDGDDQVSVGQPIHIEAGKSTGDAVCIGCSIMIEGEVEGDAVAVGGRIEVRSGGTVGGNVVSVGRRVDVASGGTVEGDAVAVGGRVFIEEGGTVEGQRSSVGWGSSWFGGPTSGMVPIDFSGSFSDLFWSILRTLLLMLVAAIVILFLRGPVERTSRRLIDEPWRAIFAGLLTQLLFFPVLVLATVILAVSIIGIPLLVLVPVAILAFFLAMIVGFVAVAQALGRWGRDRFGWHLSEPFLTVLVGVALIQVITIIGRFVGLFGSVGGLIGFSLLCLGFFLKYVAWTMGLGGMVLSTLAKDWRRPSPAGFAPPPPLAPIDFNRDDVPPAGWSDEPEPLAPMAQAAPEPGAPPVSPASAELDRETESLTDPRYGDGQSDDLRERNG